MTKRQSIFRLALAVLAGSLAVFLVFKAAPAPRPGFLYNRLMEYRPQPDIAPSLLHIVTGLEGEGEVLDPMVLVSLLSVLSEMDAAFLLIQAPLLGMSAAAGTGEVLRQFEDEFSRIEENIQGLFEGIKTGSIPPQQTDRYVGGLLNLIDRGKERLVSQLDSPGQESLERAASAFGRAWIALDGWIPVFPFSRREAFSLDGGPADNAEASEGGLGDAEAGGADTGVQGQEWYSRASPDSDGSIRRIAPVRYADGNEQQYTAYAALCRYLGIKEVERNDMGLALYTSINITLDVPENAPNGAPGGAPSGDSGGAAPDLSIEDLTEGRRKYFIPLDKNGDMFMDLPRPSAFPSLALSYILSYEEIDRALYRALSEMSRQGYFDRLAPERFPNFLYEFALAAREEMLRANGAANGGADSGDEKRLAWLGLRLRYIESLKNLFEGNVESSLVNNYEVLIADRYISYEGKEKLREMRNKLIMDFAEARALYNNFLSTREELEKRLNGAFCALGPASAASSPRARITTPTDSEASLIFANNVITGGAILVAGDLLILVLAFITVLISALLLNSFGAAMTLFFGLILGALAVFGFSLAFLFNSCWLEPALPGLGVWAAALVPAVISLCANIASRGKLRGIYAPFAPPFVLRRLIREGRDPLSSRLEANAVIAALYGGVPLDNDKPEETASRLSAFREKASELLKKSGAAIIGCEGNVVLAAFGSPLEGRLQDGYYPKWLIGNYPGPEERAVRLARELPFDREHPWRLGIDGGSCVFTYTEASGYSAFGKAVTRAKLLAGVASRNKKRVLVSDSFRIRLEVNSIKVKKLVPLGEECFELFVDKN